MTDQSFRESALAVPPGEPPSRADCLVIGGGPAGLTAAYALSRHTRSVAVFEQDPVRVGGLSQTAEYRGFHFDVGGHRFFSKARVIEDLWTEILGADLLVRERLSRIFYKGQYFHYPLRPLDAFLKMGPLETARAIASFGQAQLFPRSPVVSFEDWVVNQFGQHLYQAFFKSYTEKVWGIPCTEISADWAAQRIKGLSLGALIRSTLLPPRGGRDRVIKTLIDRFRYPKLGPGMMWQRVTGIIRERGLHMLQGAKVVGIQHERGRAQGVTYRRAGSAELKGLKGDHLISSMPLRSLVRGLDPAAPPAVRRAAEGLRYRDFLTVSVIVKRGDVFPDNWIYVHDGSVNVGRIQNFKNWSPFMVPDDAYSCLGLEYFCNEGDGLWNAPDGQLLEMAGRELKYLRLVDPAWIEDGTVVRMRKAYPVYDDAYRENVRLIRLYLERELPNLQVVGRNGMHKYNNQDHAMMTALLAVRNTLGDGPFNLWKVNGDAQYLEEVNEDDIEDGRLVPQVAPT